MSDVPEGYKMSKVGVILDGYKMIKMRGEIDERFTVN